MFSVIFLQTKGLNISGFTSAFLEFVAGKSGATVTESAKFDEPKPDKLDISEDSWASLQLRVDPLARAILDPHNLYLGSSLLTVLLAFVALAVKPGFDMRDGDDDFNVDDDYNDKYNQEDDWWKNHDVEDNQYMYRNRAVARQKVLWTVAFALTVSAVVGVTAIVAYMIETRNSRVDTFIEEVCEEVRERFEQEGYDIQYKSRIVDSGVIGHFIPERLLCFRQMDDDEIGRGRENSYTPPNANDLTKSSSKRRKEASFGTINVMVPDGYKPGQVVNVMTPSGLPIMVAVPSGLNPGESFPVQIPAQMYRPRK